MMCTDDVVGVNVCIGGNYVCIIAFGTVCESKFPLLRTIKNESESHKQKTTQLNPQTLRLENIHHIRITKSIFSGSESFHRSSGFLRELFCVDESDGLRRTDAITITDDCVISVNVIIKNIRTPPITKC